MDQTKTEEEIRQELKDLEEQEKTPEQVDNDLPGPEIEDESEPVKVEQPKQEIPKKLIDEPKKIGAPFSGKLDRLKSFIVECKRVLRVTKKPNREEFATIVKISAIGMGVIGLIGFIIHFAKELLF